MIDWTDCLGSSLAGAAMASKCDEYKHEARRVRRIVKGMLDGMDTTGVVIEFYTERRINRHRDPGIGLVICAPTLDEHNLGPAAQMAIQEWFRCAGDDPESIEVGAVSILGTEGDE